jgi:Protein of unknown function (DUF1569)
VHTIWNSVDRESLLARFGRLPPTARPKWGKLDAPRMVTHVTDALRSGMGELALTPIRSPLQYWPVNTLVMFYLPWPKGAPTAPELLNREPLEWEAELEALRGAMARFAARDVQGPWSVHVAFGRISGEQWVRLMYRHLDYHLGQFGG